RRSRIGRSEGRLAQAREVVRERFDIGLGNSVERVRHDRVAAGPLVLLVGEHGRSEEVLALSREARHLLSSAEVRQMAVAAAILCSHRLATLEERLVERALARLRRQLRVVRRHRDDIRVLDALQKILHHLRAAQSLARQNQVVLEKDPGLPGERRRARERRVAVRAMTSGADLEPLFDALREGGGNKKGGEEKSPPPHAKRLHYFFLPPSVLPPSYVMR